MRVCNHKLPKGVTCGVCLYCGKEVQKVSQLEEKGKAPEPVYVVVNEKTTQDVVIGPIDAVFGVTLKETTEEVFQSIIARFWLPHHLLGEPRYHPQG